MTLHLTRSDRGVGRRKERDDQMVLPVILIGIVDGPIMGRRQREIEYFAAHQIHSFLSPCCREGQKEEAEQDQPEPIPIRHHPHGDLLSITFQNPKLFGLVLQ